MRSSKSPPQSSIGYLHHSLRYTCLYTLCAVVFSLIISFVFIFEVSAFTISGWWAARYKSPVLGLDNKVSEICSSVTDNSLKPNPLDLARIEAFCARERLLVRFRKELSGLNTSLLQKLDQRRNILVTQSLDGYKSDEIDNNNQKLQERIDDLSDKVQRLVNFLPLRDLAFKRPQDEGPTWFMSTFPQSMEDENGLLNFPSNKSNERILCVKGRDTSDGTKNSYALAWKDDLPQNSTLLPGLTFISREYHYSNIWHALRALGPFLKWNKIDHQTAKPQRLVLYKQGELALEMGPWIAELVHAALGYEVPIDTLQGYGDGPICFESSVVNRHGFASFSAQALTDSFDAIREKAREFCHVTDIQRFPDKVENLTSFNFTLLTREGNRSFKNESAVSSIFDNECRKVPGCRFRTVRSNNLTFCDQVRVLSTTQVLVSVHGAQMTNMVFMERGCHVMEIYPKGWLEFGGSGQYVYRWLADWTKMRHEGEWRDTEGPECPNPEKRMHCFFFYKNGQVGYNQTSLSSWSLGILRKVGSSPSDY